MSRILVAVINIKINPTTKGHCMYAIKQHRSCFTTSVHLIKDIFLFNKPTGFISNPRVPLLLLSLIFIMNGDSVIEATGPTIQS